MARNTSIILAPHFDEFITAQFKNSRYSLVGPAQAALFAAGVNLTTLLLIFIARFPMIASHITSKKAIHSF